MTHSATEIVKVGPDYGGVNCNRKKLFRFRICSTPLDRTGQEYSSTRVSVSGERVIIPEILITSVRIHVSRSKSPNNLKVAAKLAGVFIRGWSKSRRLRHTGGTPISFAKLGKAALIYAHPAI